MTLAVRCPAKVNLMLQVLGRRDDGYHEIRTILQAVDLWDRLEAAPATELALTCDDPQVPTDESNLVLRAARRLKEYAARGTTGAALRLQKRIPVGGGLGGGSSDAAGALVLLSRLWGVSLASRDLETIAADLGADVPFFLEGGTVLGTGRGDRLKPLPFIGEVPILLGIAPFGIETADVYGRLGVRLTPHSNDARLSGLSSDKWPGGNDFRFAVNDLESVVYEGWPELAVFRDALWAEGAALALLSGSGSTVFGVFEAPERLRSAQASLARRFERWRVVPTRAIRGAIQTADRTGRGGEMEGGSGGWRSPRFAYSP